jgi:hypothetical protein
MKIFRNAKRSKNMKMNRLKKLKTANAVSSRSGLGNAAAAWTLHLVAPLFTWEPATKENPSEQKGKMAKSELVQGELFPDQLADGTLRRPQPVGLLEA